MYIGTLYRYIGLYILQRLRLRQTGTIENNYMNVSSVIDNYLDFTALYKNRNPTLQ